MNDGPQGFRDNEHPGSTTAWPCSLAIAATFDAEAAREWGAAMGAEFHGKGANVQLGPGLCLVRTPPCLIPLGEGVARSRYLFFTRSAR